MSLISTIGNTLLGGLSSKIAGWGQTFEQRRAADDARLAAQGYYTATENEAAGLPPETLRKKTASPVVPQVPLTPSGGGSTSSAGLMNASFTTTPAMATLPSLAGTALRALPGAGAAVAGAVTTAVRGAGALAKKYPGAVGLVGGFLVDAAGNLIRDAFGRPVRRKHRRINPLNHRALKRALRRVKAVRHIIRAVERELPHHRRSAPRCKPKCR